MELHTKPKYYVIRIFLCLIAITLILSIATLAQQRNLKTEILVYIKADSLELSLNQTESFSIDKIPIRSGKLKSALEQVSPNSIAKAFPNWTKNASLKVLENGVRVKKPNLSRIFILTFSSEEKAKQAVERLSKEPSVLYAEPHMDASISSNPVFLDQEKLNAPWRANKQHIINSYPYPPLISTVGYDPLYPDQWHLNNTGQSTGGTVDADIDAPEAWQIFTGSSSIKIAVFDTGVDYEHDDFSGKLTGDDRDPFGDNDFFEFHGTHVAGVAAAKANNDRGGRGVDWNAKIISKQIIDGTGYYFGDSYATNKMYEAVDIDNVDIINHSWSGTYFSTLLRSAFAYAYKMNKVNVAAMGNDKLFGNPTKFPAAFGQGVIAVGGTQNNDSRSPFSQTGNHIGVVAPGGLNYFNNVNDKDILSTWSNNSTRFSAGTSQAAPQVSGIASLLKGYNNNLYNDDIEQLIKISADKVSGMNGQNYTTEYGYGRVNAHKALLRLQSPYVINHYTATGGTIANETTKNILFIDTPGLADEWYYVKQVEVRKNVTFPYLSDVHVWGRGVATNGYSDANPNFAMGWTGVVSNSVGGNQATLKTYVYEVYDEALEPIGWFPTSPSNVTFAYTAHGIPAPLLRPLQLILP